jgi:metal-responsive CopG/Arc/MetJ family transcriptional regulator
MSNKHRMAKIAITIDAGLLQRLDILVDQHFFNNRSQAFQQVMEKHVYKLEHKRLARECAKLDKTYEQSLADEGLDEDLKEWPDY